MDILLRRRVSSGDDHWLISEVDARSVPGARGDRCLVCQNEQVVRRLWFYPPGWHELSDVALIALCDGKLADVATRGSEPRPAERATGPWTGQARDTRL